MILKIPSKYFPQNEFLCEIINSILKRKKYKELYSRTLLIKYDKNDNTTKHLSAICDARVTWGGDSTINNVRQYEIPLRSVDLAFADRYSICLINQESLISLSSREMSKLIQLFYNDIFTMDQNACSSPHMVIWFGKSSTNMKELFWNKLEKYVISKYEMKMISVIDKYTKFCETAIGITVPFQFKNYSNYVYRLSLKQLPSNIHEFRGNCGNIYEYNASSLHEITHIINNRYQTLTYYGLNHSSIVDYIRKNKLHGVDRIVPVGKALDISLIWDGIEVINNLSRIIDSS